MEDAGSRDGTACGIPQPLTPPSFTLLLYMRIYHAARLISSGVFGHLAMHKNEGREQRARNGAANREWHERCDPV